MKYGEQKWQQRVDFLTKLGELMQEYNAEFEVNTEFQHEGSFTTEVEVYCDGCSNLCGEQRDGLTAAGVERMLHCATEELAEAQAYGLDVSAKMNCEESCDGETMVDVPDDLRDERMFDDVGS